MILCTLRRIAGSFFSGFVFWSSATYLLHSPLVQHCILKIRTRIASRMKKRSAFRVSKALIMEMQEEDAIHPIIHFQGTSFVLVMTFLLLMSSIIQVATSLVYINVQVSESRLIACCEFIPAFTCCKTKAHNLQNSFSCCLEFGGISGC